MAVPGLFSAYAYVRRAVDTSMPMIANVASFAFFIFFLSPLFWVPLQYVKVSICNLLPY